MNQRKAWIQGEKMLSYNLEGKVALITGSSRSIGAAIALRLAHEGADIVINYARHEEAAQEVAKKVRMMNRRVLVIQADVSETEPVRTMVHQVIDAWGHIDILVSNATWDQSTNGQPIADISDEAWDQEFGVSVKGLFHTAREIMPLMEKQHSGKIVAISSIVAKTGRSMLGLYTAAYAGAKAGIVGVVRGLAREAAPYGVNVNCIRPGWIDTEEHLQIPHELRKPAIQQMPLGRTGLPEDIANAVAFLVSEDSSYMTGQILDINGGLFIG
jgi:3-oxoacyl-[acyl-carrier protein] reductase